MRIFRIFYAASLLAVMTAAGAGCGDDTGTTNTVINGKTLSDLDIATDIDTLSEGSSMAFKAMATYADGTREDVTKDDDAVWNTSDPDVATVDDDGVVTAVDEGVVEIMVTFGGMTADETFFVGP